MAKAKGKTAPKPAAEAAPEETPFTIDKNIPIPPRISRGSKYRFAEMEPGDSFRSEPGDKAKLRGAASAFKKAHGGKFAVRSVVEKDELGLEREFVRVWRVE